ncbi:MAG TPA: ankyrin repeat domain-containing protein, partial [Candidatus Acidoferrum sp.]|nr:ankyrin repeat domain-containing protein [Candidatus Acidoferrum sp.]
TLEGQTALMSVVRTPNVDAAELLIKKGANVNARESWRGQTALMFASAQSQPAMVELLLKHGAKPDEVSHEEEWERQVTAEPRPQSRPFGAFTALLFAAREGCVGCTKALVQHKADINQVDPNGITPLLMATLNARWDVAAYLIEAGADVNRWDTWGRSPLYSTVDYNTVPRGGRPDRPSQDATSPVQVATMLLDKGANPNVMLKVFPPYRSLGNDRGGDSMLSSGTTPLLRAAKAADVAMVELLLKRGALPDLKNWQGYTPFMAVAGLGTNNVDIRGRFRDEKNGIAVAKMLIAAGVNMNATEDQGRRAIHGAVLQGWGEFIKFMVQNGADLNAEDKFGNSALDYAMGRISGGLRQPVSANNPTVPVLLELGAKAGSAQNRSPAKPQQ